MRPKIKVDKGFPHFTSSTTLVDTVTSKGSCRSWINIEKSLDDGKFLVALVILAVSVISVVSVASVVRSLRLFRPS